MGCPEKLLLAYNRQASLLLFGLARYRNANARRYLVGPCQRVVVLSVGAGEAVVTYAAAAKKGTADHEDQQDHFARHRFHKNASWGLPLVWSACDVTPHQGEHAESTPAGRRSTKTRSGVVARGDVVRRPARGRSSPVVAPSSDQRAAPWCLPDRGGEPAVTRALPQPSGRYGRLWCRSPCLNWRARDLATRAIGAQAARQNRRGTTHAEPPTTGKPGNSAYSRSLGSTRTLTSRPTPTRFLPTRKDLPRFS